jgi:hypothetical protein
MQNRNKYTEIEHFIANESFRSWVCSNKDQDYWEEWTLKMLLIPNLLRKHEHGFSNECFSSYDFVKRYSKRIRSYLEQNR